MKEMMKWNDFTSGLEERGGDIAAMLPAGVSLRRFTTCALAAVKQQPQLLSCDPRSLFSAVLHSAQDGLLPDGKQGVILYFRSNGNQTAQWIPMVHGIRKRAWELEQIIVDAQVVYENDEFSWRQGDSPMIEHSPVFGQECGSMIGAYAIFRYGTKSEAAAAILHREVMDAAQIDAVRKKSRQPDGLLWTEFKTEAWKKTVVRRGFKTIPLGEKLDATIRRDDVMYDFDERAQARPAPELVQGRQKEPPLVSSPTPAVVPATQEA